jgi:hypothetical protein
MGFGGAALAGHHVAAPIIIPTGGGVQAMFQSAGPMVDVLDEPARNLKGQLKPGALVSLQTIRAREAIVLTEALRDGDIDIPAGAILMRVEAGPIGAKPSSPDWRVMWCGLDVKRGLRLLGAFPGPRVDCLESADRSMTLNGFTTAALIGEGGRFSPFDIYGVTGRSPLSHAAVFRFARQEELPRGQIGYRVCKDETEGKSRPWRFSTVMSAADGSFLGLEDDCPFGDWPNASDHSLLVADRIQLKISSDGVPTFEVVKSVAPGALASLRPAYGFAAAEAAPPEAKRALEAFLTVPFRALAKPSIGENFLKHGDVVAQVQVAHGATAVVKYDVYRGQRQEKPWLSAGQYMFGVPMSGARNPFGVVWCAPLPGRAANTYNVTCFVPGDLGYFAVDAGGSLMPLSLMWTGTPTRVPEFEVERKTVELGAPMILTWVFDRWVVETFGDKHFFTARLGVEVRVNGVMSPMGHLEVLPDAQGRVRFSVLGGVIDLTPTLVDDHKPSTPPLNASRAELDRWRGNIDDGAALTASTGAFSSAGALPIFGIIQWREPRPISAQPPVQKPPPASAPPTPPSP